MADWILLLGCKGVLSRKLSCNSGAIVSAAATGD
jgi:hypothetical protein